MSSSLNFTSSRLTTASENEESKGNVKVLWRFRPLNSKELDTGMIDNLEFMGDSKTVKMTINESGMANAFHSFTYDYVFKPTDSQELIYTESAKPIIDSVLEGFNGTVFAYGQTSSGKTHTMMGPDIYDNDGKGIIPRMVSTVFDTIENSGEYLEFTVKVGYCEIYLEKIRDLLNPEKSNLSIHEDKNRGIYIADLTEEYVSSRSEVYDIMQVGSSNREVGSTNMNEGSSRSHSIFMITITQNNTLDYSAKAGKLTLVDLAGSEKVGKTGAEGKRLDEAKNINKSLSALGKVINSLTDNKSTHIPYRDSKLTRVLQDSLGGNSKTALIITCSPARFNEFETLSTLRFGTRAKSIKNKPRINKELTVAELKLLLTHAEEAMGHKDRKIIILEQTIINCGGTIPTEQYEDTSIQMSHASSEVTEEVMRELELEREKLSSELKRNEQLNKALEGKTKACETLRVENENLIRKFSGESLKVQALKERCLDKDEHIERLNGIMETVNSDLQNVNSSKVHLEQKLLDKEYEIDQLQQSSQLSSNRSQVVNKLIDDKEALEVELQLANEQLAERQEYIESIRASESLTVTQLREQNDEAQRICKTLRNELLEVKEHANRLESAVPQERTQYEAQIAELKELLKAEQENVSRAKLENGELKENNTHLEGVITEGDKALKKKVNSLERNLEQLTLMYHQLVSQKQILKVDNQVNEKKILRKNERILHLEKQLNQAREKLQSYKIRLCTMESELAGFKEGASTHARMSVHIRKKIIGGRKKVLRGSAVPNVP